MPSNIIMLAEQIKGDCDIKNYEGGIYLDSYSFSVGSSLSSDRSIHSGNDGFSAWSDVSISKPEDRSDFMLMKKAAHGDHIKGVRIVVLSDDGKSGTSDAAPSVDKIIDMTEVIIQETSIDGFANSHSSRAYTLNWEQLKMTFKYRKEDGEEE